MQKYSVVMTACGSGEEARALARSLVEGQLAACVQLLPIESLYRWQGELCHDDEVLLLIKGRTADFGLVRDAIVEAHSYDLPEITQVPITDGLADYLSWLDDSATGHNSARGAQSLT
jgi:periplasmic divalent cation tolerance protein